MVIKPNFLVKNRFQWQIPRLSSADSPWTVRHFEGCGIPGSILKLSAKGPIATIVLDRPGEGNLVSSAMATELREACADLAADYRNRVVILTGNGPVFSVGRANPEAPLSIRDYQAASALTSLPVPVLVAMNGNATDHGLELALAGDLRLAVSGASFGFSPPSAGSFPFDGGTQRLPRLVGSAWARDMLLTGRRVDASEALAIGLVNRVAETTEDLMRMTLELAEQIAEGSPIGARYAKEAVTSGADMTLPQGLVLETDLNVLLQRTGDRAEGISSFLERRNPHFTGE